MTSFARVSIQWGRDDPTMEPRGWSRERTAIRGLLEGSPSEITSHARLGGTIHRWRAFGRVKKRKSEEQKDERGGGVKAFVGEKDRAKKKRRRVTILLSFLDPQKSRFSTGHIQQ